MANKKVKKFSKKLEARITQAEYDKVLSKIGGTKITKSEFLRNAVLLNSTEVKEIDKDFQKRVLFLLSNISNNVNQIAKHSNINKRLDKQVLERLEEVIDFSKSVTKGAIL